MEVTTLQIALAVAAALGVGFWFGWWSKHRQQSTQRAMLDELWTRKLKSYEQALEEAQTAHIQTSTRVQSSAREIAAAQARAREAEAHAEALVRRIGELEEGVGASDLRARTLEQSRERIGRELVLARRELAATREALAERERRLGALERLPAQLEEREGELALLERRLREDRDSRGVEIARLQEWVDDLAHLPGVLERREAELLQNQERLVRVEAEAASEALRLGAALRERELVQRKLEGRLRQAREEQERERARTLRMREELEALRDRARELAARHLELERESAAKDEFLAQALEQERALMLERSREYERSTADLGREYERTLAERCDEYERWIAAREDEHASLSARLLDRERETLERTAGEYEGVLVDLHRGHRVRLEQLEANSRAGFSALESAAAAERQELLRAAEEALAQARLSAGEELELERLSAREALEAERRAAREALEEERALALRTEAERDAIEQRELELVRDLECSVAEYEATLAEVYRAGATRLEAAPLPPAEADVPTGVHAGAEAHARPDATVGCAETGVVPPELAPDPLAAVLASPLLELEAAASPFELERARERLAALLSSRGPSSALSLPAHADLVEPAAAGPLRRMRARPPRVARSRGALEVDPHGPASTDGTSDPRLETEPGPTTAVAESPVPSVPEAEPTPVATDASERDARPADDADPTSDPETQTLLEPAPPPRRRRAVPPSLPKPLRARKSDMAAAESPAPPEPDVAAAPAPEVLREEELVPQAPPAGGAHRSSPRDELMRVRGIGPTLADRLVAVGCDSLRELANVGEARVEELARELRIPPARIRRERWIELARDLVASESKP